MRGGKAQPVHHRNAFLCVLASAGDDNGVEGLARVYLVQTMVRQQIEARLAVDHLMRLGGRQLNLVARGGCTLRMQAVGLHQDVGNAGGLKQHAAVGDDNQYFLHVLKSNLFTK